MSKSSTITTNPGVKLAGPPIHPGELLSDELKALGASASDAARSLGVPVNRITEILRKRRAVTADTALRLGQWLGSGPEIWMALQQDYDLRFTRKLIGNDLKRIPRRKVVRHTRLVSAAA